MALAHVINYTAAIKENYYRVFSEGFQLFGCGLPERFPSSYSFLLATLQDDTVGFFWVGGGRLSFQLQTNLEWSYAQSLRMPSLSHTWYFRVHQNLYFLEL